jgi:hypothetical protein
MAAEPAADGRLHHHHRRSVPRRGASTTVERGAGAAHRIAMGKFFPFRAGRGLHDPQERELHLSRAGRQPTRPGEFNAVEQSGSLAT